MARTVVRSALLCATLMALAGTCAASDYYLSPQGDDAGPGNRMHPWRTLARASRARYRPADKILLEGGSCFYGSLKMECGEDAGTGRRLTIGSYGNGRATIDAGDGTAIEIHDRGGIEIRDLIVTGAGLPSNNGFGVLVINSAARAIRLAHVRIENVEALGFRWAGIYVGGDLCCDAPAGVRALAGF